MKKYRFEKRGMSRLKALSGNSGPSEFPRGVQNQRFLYQFLKLKQEALDRDYEGGHQSSSYGTPGFENWEQFIHTNTSWLFWTIRSQLKVTETKGVVCINNPEMWTTFVGKLRGRYEAYSCGQRWRFRSTKIKINSILWKNQNIEIVMQGKYQWFDSSMNFHKFQLLGRD